MNMILFLDALTVLFLVVMGFFGFRRGLIEELGRLLGLILATILAFRYYVDLAGFILKWLNIDAWVTVVLSYILVFFIVFMAVRMITRLIQLLFLPGSTKWMNRFMGSFFGLAKGFLIVMVFLWLVELLPNRDTAVIVQKESRLANRLNNMRKNIVITFNWSDPVGRGEIYIRDFLNTQEEKDG